MWWIWLIILAAVAAVIIVLVVLGKKAKKRQAEQEEQIEASKQVMSMLIIDKKKLRIKDSGLPQMVIDQTPKLMRRSKLPIVKAKIGPRIMSLVADESVYDLIPVKKEIKAEVSGIYIMSVRGLRGSLTPPAKKPGFFQRLKAKATSIADKK